VGACSSVGQKRNTYNILEDLGIDGKIILEWILGK
jgi:hypothetical protein